MKIGKNGLLATCLCFVAISALGETQKKTTKVSGARAIIPSPEVSVDLPEAEIEKLARMDFPSKGRDVAGGRVPDDSPANMSPQYKKFRDDLLTLKDPEMFLKTLNNYDVDATYAALPLDMQFAVAQLIPLRQYAGIIYRMRPVLEETNARMVQDFAINQIRSIFERFFIYYPTDRYDSMLRFFAEPMSNEPVFRTENDIQTFFATKVYGDLVRAVKRLEKLNLSKTPVVWDNRLRYGDVAFIDGISRYRFMGEAERFIALARYHKRMHWIAYGVSYDLSGVISLKKEIGKHFGIDAVQASIFGGGNNGVPRSEIVEVMNEDKFSKIYTKTSSGEAWMKEAWRNLRLSSAYANAAWKNMRSKSHFDYSLVDTVSLNPKEKEVTAALSSQWDLVKAKEDEDGTAGIRGVLSSTLYKVNFKNFYFKPTSDLKLLLPIKPFQSGSLTLTKTIGGKRHSYRNYDIGNARNWSTEEYAKVFPELAKGEDLPKFMRVVAEARGTRAMLTVLSPFVH